MTLEFGWNRGLFVARSRGPKKPAEAVNRPNLTFAVSPKYLSDETKIYIFISRIPRGVYKLLGGFFQNYIFPPLVDIYRHPFLSRLPTKISKDYISLPQQRYLYRISLLWKTKLWWSLFVFSFLYLTILVVGRKRQRRREKGIYGWNRAHEEGWKTSKCSEFLWMLDHN